jgi:hypothetical protein
MRGTDVAVGGKAVVVLVVADAGGAFGNGGGMMAGTYTG